MSSFRDMIEAVEKMNQLTEGTEMSFNCKIDLVSTNKEEYSFEFSSDENSITGTDDVIYDSIPNAVRGAAKYLTAVAKEYE